MLKLCPDPALFDKGSKDKDKGSMDPLPASLQRIGPMDDLATGKHNHILHCTALLCTIQYNNIDLLPIDTL